MSRLVLLLLALTCSTSWAQAEDAREFSQEQLAFFETKIRPVLVEQCLACHSNDDKQKGGLSLTSRAGLLRGGESGPAIAPGNPDASLLLEALRYESYEMPPKGKLPARIIDDFAQWIAMGAPDPRVESAPAKKAEHVIDATQLWSLQPLSVVDPPEVDTVKYGEFGNAEVTATLFGGMDASLYADFQKDSKALMNASTTELKHAHGPYGPAHMAIEGRVLEVARVEGEVPLGSSGIQIRMKIDMVLEGFRPGRTVRVRPKNWPKVQVPREEWLPMSFSIEERFPTPAIFPKYGR